MTRHLLHAVLIGTLLGLLVVLVGILCGGSLVLWQREKRADAGSLGHPAYHFRIKPLPEAELLIPPPPAPQPRCTMTKEGEDVYTWDCRYPLPQQSCDALYDCVEL